MFYILENEQEATHILFPVVDPLDEEYARPVYKNKERWIQMHWYYFPDSHDSWVNTEVPVEPPEILYGNHQPTPWRVIFKFLCIEIFFLSNHLLMIIQKCVHISFLE